MIENYYKFMEGLVPFSIGVMFIWFGVIQIKRKNGHCSAR